MTPRLTQRTFIICPVCGIGEYDITHPLVGSTREKGCRFGWMSCSDDGCRTEIRGTVAVDGSIEIEHRERKPAGLALLTMGGRYFVLTQYYRIEEENADYFYHSRQCPTNLLSQVINVFDPEHGEDPHGILRYVSSIEFTLEVDKALNDAASLTELFALFHTDGQPAPSVWPESEGGMHPLVANWQRQVLKRGDA